MDSEDNNKSPQIIERPDDIVLELCIQRAFTNGELADLIDTLKRWQGALQERLRTRRPQAVTVHEAAAEHLGIRYWRNGQLYVTVQVGSAAVTRAWKDMEAKHIRMTDLHGYSDEEGVVIGKLMELFT